MQTKSPVLPLGMQNSSMNPTSKANSQPRAGTEMRYGSNIIRSFKTQTRPYTPEPVSTPLPSPLPSPLPLPPFFPPYHFPLLLLALFIEPLVCVVAPAD